MHNLLPAVILFFLLLCTAQVTSAPSLHFSRIDKDKGLTGNIHKSICQDSTGMIWISCSNGVVRYDGMSFQRFRYDINDSNSVSGQINNIHLDRKGQIWLATPTGIQSFRNKPETFKAYNIKDPRGGVFYSFINSIQDYGDDTLLLISALDGPIFFNPSNSNAEFLRNTLMRNTLPRNEDYLASSVDKNRNILFSTKHNGFYFWDNNTLRGQHYLEGVEGINTICLDDYGRFWFPFGDHLAYFTPQTGQITHVNIQLTDNIEYKKGIHDMLFFQEKLFIGTVGDGLLVMDTISKTTDRYINDPKNPYSLPDNGIKSLYQDNAKNLWVSSAGNGLAILKNIQKAFSQDIVLTECNFSRCNYVNAILISKDGTLWAGMDGGGLNYRRYKDTAFTSLLRLSDKNVHGITSLADGVGNEIWVGSFDMGLFKLDYKGKLISNYSTNKPSASGDCLRSNFIESIKVASNGKVWLATNGGGVVVFDELTGKMKYIVLDANNLGQSISCSDATSFYEDSKHRMWVTTYWGLNLFDIDGEYIDKWVNDEYRLSNISSNISNRVKEDSSGTFWIATGYGINYFKYGDKKFKFLCEEDGLVNNTVNRLEIDKQGNIWAATDEGLSKYNRSNNSFYNFFDFNGLPSTAFRKASFAAEDGKLYFGTDNGIISFYPDQIGIDTTEPTVLITAFKLFNKKVLAGTGSVLDKSIIETTEIELSANQNYIGFEFSALSFVDFQKSKFKYRLIGTEQDWTETDVSKRYADYSNLSPGDYTFQVLGTNNDGVWSSTPTEIKIRVIPPFYKNALFRFIFISAALICIFYIMRWRERTLSRDNERLEKAIEERTAIIAAKNIEINEQNERLLVLNNTKDRYFSIIAHDLKNPLNALMGFSGLLNDKYEELPDVKKKKFIGVINESSRNMYGLLINLLDWSRSQTGNIHYDPGVYNLQPIVEESIILITTQAEHKGIRLVNQITSNYRIVADINMLKTVLRNLLTNAIKFSFRSDSVVIGISNESSELVTIFIKDSGVGMSDDQISRLFADNTSKSVLGTEKEQGSGLGLIICKEFIELNKGEVWCTSSPNKGTTMHFTIPLSTNPPIIS